MSMQKEKLFLSNKDMPKYEYDIRILKGMYVLDFGQNTFMVTAGLRQIHANKI